MNPEAFLKEFGHLAETEGGIASLRSLILQLATSGILVEASASETVDSVKLLAASRSRNSGGRGTTAVAVPPRPPLPATWGWVPIRAVTSLVTDGEHQTPPRISRGIPLVTAKNVRDGHMDLSNTDYVSEEVAAKCRRRCAPTDGDILMVCVGATTGRLTVVLDPPEMVLVRSVALIRPTSRILADYLSLSLRSPAGQQQVWAGVKRSAQPCLYLSRIEEIMLALPPLPEQKRIVEKVDQLMALCDELEAKQKQKRAKAVVLNKAALSSVVHADSKTALKNSWSRVQDHFEVLYELPENVKELRQTILQLAVMGKLVRQEGGDARPVSESLAVVPLGSLGVFLGGGTPSKARADFWSGDIPWVSPKDMKVLFIDDAIDHISEEAVVQSAVKRIPSGSLLAVTRGMILAHSFPVALTTREVTINQDMKALVLATPELAPYLLLAMRGLRDNILSKVERSSHGTCRLDSHLLAAQPIPVPPLAEQKRIVAKVDQLMALCDELDVKLAQHRDQGQRLMRAVVEGLVA